MSIFFDECDLLELFFCEADKVDDDKLGIGLYYKRIKEEYSIEVLIFSDNNCVLVRIFYRNKKIIEGRFSGVVKIFKKEDFLIISNKTKVVGHINFKNIFKMSAGFNEMW